MQLINFCTKFKTDTAIAKTCSITTIDITFRRELCEAIPTASLTDGCTAYWNEYMTNGSLSDQNIFYSLLKTNAKVALDSTLLDSLHEMPV